MYFDLSEVIKSYDDSFILFLVILHIKVSKFCKKERMSCRMSITPTKDSECWSFDFLCMDSTRIVYDTNHECWIFYTSLESILISYYWRYYLYTSSLL